MSLPLLKRKKPRSSHRAYQLHAQFVEWLQEENVEETALYRAAGLLSVVSDRLCN